MIGIDGHHGDITYYALGVVNGVLHFHVGTLACGSYGNVVVHLVGVRIEVARFIDGYVAACIYFNLFINAITERYVRCVLVNGTLEGNIKTCVSRRIQLIDIRAVCVDMYC